MIIFTTSVTGKSWNMIERNLHQIFYLLLTVFKLRFYRYNEHHYQVECQLNFLP